MAVGDDERSLSIEELAEATGVPVRTIRFYIGKGLLAGPGARGKQAAYSDEHEVRLALIRRLAEQRVPLEEIRWRLAQLSTTEVQALLSEEEGQSARLAEASPREYVAALLRRSRHDGLSPPMSPAQHAPRAPF